ncbi:phosphonate ABC transporter, permease protein PhnE [Streptomyces sp. NPDC001508]|uniref:phosphonate ABC transporter, permease protein PhnE n=1 Tax=Streptomyces sp. NPDC001508 TaxID=3154656 RepID=UPI00332E21B4
MSLSMTDRAQRQAGHPPPRLPRTSPFLLVVAVVVLGGFVWGIVWSGLNPSTLVSGAPGLVNFLGKAFPPVLEQGRTVASATGQTIEMAIVGTVFGAVASLPVAVLAARNLSPAPLAATVRSLVTSLRAIPDLVWGLVFVVAVGLGPAAGICAIAVDTIGYCGRLFAERVEELDPAPLRALRATGAHTPAVIVCGVVPAVLPSFVATSMFALEKAVRSAVVLGLVGAGGIGIDLSTDMQLFQYQQALTIVIIIFVVVIAVERVSAAVRRRIL